MSIPIDVTESRGIEGELRLKSAALNAAAHAIVITDREGRITWVNEAVTSLTGYSSAELLGQNPRIFKSGQHDAGFYQELWEAVTAGRLWRGEVTNRRKDGSLYVEEMNITPVRDAQGAITHFIAIKQDITARRRAELELGRSQELNRQLVESVPAGIVLFSDRGKVMSSNAEAERLLGLSFSELCKQRLADWAAMAIHENGRPLGARGHPVANCLRSRRPQARVTLGLQRPGGGVRWVVCTAAPVPACGREDSSGVVLAFVDITERKRAEQSLRESEARQRAMLQSSLDCVVVMDTGEQILEFNPAAERTFGYVRGEVIGKPLPELLIAPSSRESFRQGLKHCLRTGSQRVFEKRVEITAMRKGAAEFPIETAISVTYHHGRPIFTAVLHDITERKTAQERLIQQTEDLKSALHAVRRVQERERQVLASIPSIFIGIDDHGKVTHWNPAAERQFSLRAGEVIGKPLAELPIGWRSERVREAIESCSRSGRPTHLDNLTVSTAGGRDRVLALTINRIETQDNEDLGVVVVGVDVTEHKAMESQLMLAQKMESIGQLAAGIAHEINTPTQYVSDNTRFLRDSFKELEPLLALCEAVRGAARPGSVPAQLTAELDAALEKADLPFLTKEIPQAIEQSLEGLSRVAEIVKAMKQFSHPDQDEPELADLNQAISNTVTVARNEWKYVAEMELDLEPELPPVPCQLGRFNQVVLNLIVNAAQAIAGTIGEGSQERGKIRITTCKGDGHVEIRVVDTGPGIPPQIRNKIFDPFFTTKEVGKGTGQGLAIAHNIIVEKHGGTIQVESEPGKGATFILRLPLQTAAVTAGDSA